MIKVLCTLMTMIFIASSSYAEDKVVKKLVREPANSADVSVSYILKSGNNSAEKWVDEKTGIVCYTTGSGGGIFCMPIPKR